MYGLSRAEVLGNLTRVPEIRYTPTGKGVAKFSVAINNVYTKATGEKVDDTFFMDIEAWEKVHGDLKYLNPIPLTKWMRGGENG